MKNKVKGWKSQVSRLVERMTKAPELQSSVVTHNLIDETVLKDMLELSAPLRETRNNAPEISHEDIREAAQIDPNELTEEQLNQMTSYAGWSDLFDDLFHALYTGPNPEVKPSDDVKVSRELNRLIMGEIIEDESFQALRPHTRHSDIDSALNAMSMTTALKEALTRNLGQFAALVKQIEDAEPSGDGSDGAGGEAPDPERIEQLAQKIAERDDQDQGQAQQIVRQAVRDAAEDAKETQELAKQIPGTRAGSLNEMIVAPHRIVELAKQWQSSEMLRRIALMAGRLRRDMFNARAKRIRGGGEEIVDVTTGDHIPQVLPHEMALLRHPTLKKDFQRRYHEKNLMQYETEGISNAGRGPVVVVIDGSGSMDGPPNEWARAVALSVVSIAIREKRDAAAVEFASGGQVASWEWRRRSKPDPEAMLNFVQHFYGGGTEIALGLGRADELMRNSAEFTRADIVLITDGGDSYDEEARQMRQSFVERGIRVHGVSINQLAEHNSYLQEMCDSIVGVTADDLDGANQATDMLAKGIN